MIINRLLLEVCSPCQYSCDLCAHQGMRDFDPKYQLEMDGVEALISRLTDLNCKVENLQIHGTGEPLLWKHFNPAIRRLRQSGRFNVFTVVTNGFAIGRIENDVWNEIRVLISSYPGTKIDQSILDEHPGRYEVLDRTKFLRVDHYPHSETYTCVCQGPCLYRGKIYPRCGPPLFDAALRAKLDSLSFGIDVDKWSPEMMGESPPCRWCWANVKLESYIPNVEHSFKKP
jgi:hypothetical protein